MLWEVPRVRWLNLSREVLLTLVFLTVSRLPYLLSGCGKRIWCQAIDHGQKSDREAKETHSSLHGRAAAAETTLTGRAQDTLGTCRQLMNLS